MKNTFWLGLALPLLTWVAGCGAPQTDLSQRKVRVVTTTGMITDAVQRVGGERVEMSGLMGPGIDPHLYKATAGDVGRMALLAQAAAQQAGQLRLVLGDEEPHLACIVAP